VSAARQARPLRVRIRTRVAEMTPAGRRLNQAIFARGVPRLVLPGLRRSDHPAAPALATAVAAIAGRGTERAEAEWIERIEQRRTSFARRPGAISVGHGPFPWDEGSVPPRMLAEVASIPRPWGTFLLRLVRELRPQRCLELGGAIGISAAYQGAGLKLNGTGALRTVEGATELAAAARELLGGLGLDRVEVVESSFDDLLERVLPGSAPIDLAFVDGRKGSEHNLRQLERLIPQMAAGGALVIDDVHWSGEMTRAWRAVRSHPQVGLSVDLRRLGVCVLRG
jgi:predicted O-methyltransferase YrrM